MTGIERLKGLLSEDEDREKENSLTGAGTGAGTAAGTAAGVAETGSTGSGVNRLRGLLGMDSADTPAAGNSGQTAGGGSIGTNVGLPKNLRRELYKTESEYQRALENWKLVQQLTGKSQAPQVYPESPAEQVERSRQQYAAELQQAQQNAQEEAVRYGIENWGSAAEAPLPRPGMTPVRTAAEQPKTAGAAEPEEKELKWWQQALLADAYTPEHRLVDDALRPETASAAAGAASWLAGNAKRYGEMTDEERAERWEQMEQADSFTAEDKDFISYVAMGFREQGDVQRKVFDEALRQARAEARGDREFKANYKAAGSNFGVVQDALRLARLYQRSGSADGDLTRRIAGTVGGDLATILGGAASLWSGFVNSAGFGTEQQRQDYRDTATDLLTVGNTMTEMGMQGESDLEKTVHGIANSVGENLLLGYLGGGATLMTGLSLQGAGDTAYKNYLAGRTDTSNFASTAASFAYSYLINTIFNPTTKALSGQLGDSIVKSIATGAGDNAAQAFLNTMADHVNDFIMRIVNKELPEVDSLEDAMKLYLDEFAGDDLRQLTEAVQEKGMAGVADWAANGNHGGLWEDAAGAVTGGISGGIIGGIGGVSSGLPGYVKAEAETGAEAGQAGDLMLGGQQEQTEAEEERQKDADWLDAEKVKDLLQGNTEAEADGQKKTDWLDAEAVKALLQGKTEEARALLQSRAEAEAEEAPAENPAENGEAEKAPAENEEDRTEEAEAEEAPEKNAPEESPASGTAEAQRQTMAEPGAEGQTTEARQPARQTQQSRSPDGKALAKAVDSGAVKVTGLSAEAQNRMLADYQRTAETGAQTYADAWKSVYTAAKLGTANSLQDAVRQAGAAASQVGAADETGMLRAEVLRSAYELGQAERTRVNPFGMEQATEAMTRSSAEQSRNPKGDVLIDLAASATDLAIQLEDGLVSGGYGAADFAKGMIAVSSDSFSETGTLLHELQHVFDAYNQEGATSFKRQLLTAFAESKGMSSTRQLVERYLQAYEEAGQEITYNQAADEMLNDALQGLFSTAESRAELYEWMHERAQAGAAERTEIRKVVDRLKEFFSDLLAAARKILRAEPQNAAAKQAAELSETVLKELRQQWYSQADKALENRKAAKSSGSTAEKSVSEANRGSTNRSEASGKTAEAAENGGQTAERSAGEAEAEQRAEEEAKVRHQIEVMDEELDSSARLVYSDEQMAQAAQLLQQEGLLSGKHKVSKASVEIIADRMLQKHGSTMNKETLVQRLQGLFDYIANTAANEVSWEGAMAVATDLCTDVIAQSGELNTEHWDAYPQLQKMTVYIDPKSSLYRELKIMHDGMTNARAWANSHGIRIYSGKSNTHNYSQVDQLLQELSNPDSATYVSFVDGTASGIDMLEELASAHDAIKPTVTLGMSEIQVQDEAAMMVQELFDDYLDTPEMTPGEMIIDEVKNRVNDALRLGAEVAEEARRSGQRELQRAVEAERTAAALQRSRAAKDAQQRVDFTKEQAKKQQKEALDKAREKYRQNLKKTREKLMQKSRERMQELRKSAAESKAEAVQKAQTEARTAEAEKWQRKMERLKTRQEQELAARQNLARRDLQRARDARENDKIRQRINRNTSALNQMLLRPTEQRHIPGEMMSAALEVAALANQPASREDAAKAVELLKARIDTAAKGAGTETGSELGLASDWADSGLADLADVLRGSIAARAESERLVLDSDELRMMDDLLTGMLTTIRNANRLLGDVKARDVQMFAYGAQAEISKSRGIDTSTGLSGKLNRALNSYNTGMLSAERFFRRLGGYAEDGYMENLAKQLNDGQKKKLDILRQGNELFRDVMEDQQAVRSFTGKHAVLEDIGLIDRNTGEAVPVTHAQMVSLYMHFRNAQNLNHASHGGISIPDNVAYQKGMYTLAYDNAHKVNLVDTNGDFMGNGVIAQLEAKLTDYDRAWIADIERFYDSFTKQIINGTSMELVGFTKADVENYFPIVTDSDVLQQIHDNGKALDANGRTVSTIESRGFLKSRQAAATSPILLEDCTRVVNRSLTDVADYGGMAIPLRNVKKVFNARADNGTIGGNVKAKWGSGAMQYVNDLLSDLQGTRKTQDGELSKIMARIRSGTAGSVLTLNPGVALSQAASLPTAAAVLGHGPIAKATKDLMLNLAPGAAAEKRVQAILDEAAEHTPLLWYRSQQNAGGGLEAAAANGRAVDAFMADHPSLFGWIGRTDTRTVATLWQASRYYVDGQGSYTAGSKEYWAAVADVFDKTVELTQPNYTTMQRPAVLRSPSDLMRSLTMFATQRFQNYNILYDAVGNYRAKAEQLSEATEDGKAQAEENLGKARRELGNAVSSQVLQVGVFAALKVLSDFGLHRVNRERDENGDVTLASTMKAFGEQAVSAAVGIFGGGSELLTALEIITGQANGYNTDVLSINALSSINDLVNSMAKMVKAAQKDYDSPAAAALGYATAAERVLECYGAVVGAPVANTRKLLEGLYYAVKDAAGGNVMSFEAEAEASLPSATSQYNRLYEAIMAGDGEDAAAALEKLQTIERIKSGAEPSPEALKADVRSQVKKMLKDPETGSMLVQSAAQASVDGDQEERIRLTELLTEQLAEVLMPLGWTEAEAQDLAQATVHDRAAELLKGDSGSYYTDLLASIGLYDSDSAQDEIDRLLRAGITGTAIKAAITGEMKEQYYNASADEREDLRVALLQLRVDGQRIYDAETIKAWGRK